jgi:hypothetical protein
MPGLNVHRNKVYSGGLLMYASFGMDRLCDFVNVYSI